jgi:hypothetical protein
VRLIAVCEAGWQQWKILVNILEDINYYRTYISGLGAEEAWLVYLVEGNLFFLI